MAPTRVSSPHACASCGTLLVWQERRYKGVLLSGGYYEMDADGAPVNRHFCAGRARREWDEVAPDYVPAPLPIVPTPVGGVPNAQHERELTERQRAALERGEAARRQAHEAQRSQVRANVRTEPANDPPTESPPEPPPKRLIDRLGI